MTKQKTIADIEARAAELGLKDEVQQLSKVDDEQRKTIQSLRREITQLHIQLSQLRIEMINERLDRIIERQNRGNK